MNPLTAALPVSRISTEYEDTEPLIKRYLNLTTDLSSLYAQWSSVDPNFKKRAPSFTGVRILKQDPWEALLGFICSSNNNISRISQMVCLLRVFLRQLLISPEDQQSVLALWIFYWRHRWTSVP